MKKTLVGIALAATATIGIFSGPANAQSLFIDSDGIVQISPDMVPLAEPIIEREMVNSAVIVPEDGLFHRLLEVDVMTRPAVIERTEVITQPAVIEPVQVLTQPAVVEPVQIVTPIIESQPVLIEEDRDGLFRLKLGPLLDLKLF
jgi:hypothetical protein